MSFYPRKIGERFATAEHAGEACDANVRGRGASFTCGSFTEIALRIEDGTPLIRDPRFLSNGCGFMVAAAEVITNWLEGKELADLHGLDSGEMTCVVELELGEFTNERTQCAAIVFQALRTALSDYRKRRVEEFRGETALICTCFGITEDTIVSTIDEQRLTSVEGVALACRAGSGCGSCRMLITELIDNRVSEGFRSR